MIHNTILLVIYLRSAHKDIIGAVSMLGQRIQRWTSIEQALVR